MFLYHLPMATPPPSLAAEACHLLIWERGRCGGHTMSKKGFVTKRSLNSAEERHVQVLQVPERAWGLLIRFALGEGGLQCLPARLSWSDCADRGFSI